MAWGDFNKDLVNTNAFLSVTTPLSLSWSLTLAASSSGNRAFLTPTAESGRAKGLEHGRLRVLMRLDNSTANGTGTFAGLVFMGSADTLASSSGSWYAAHKRGNNLDLRRGNTASLSAGTQLATVAHTVDTGTMFSLQVEWEVVTGQVDIVIATGSLADFSDLTTQITFSDTSGSRLTSSSAEGPYMISSGTPLAQVTSDKLTLITPG